jgi:hypothetical protein
MSGDTANAAEARALILDGLSFADKGDYLEAIDRWERALSLDPESPPALLCAEVLDDYMTALEDGRPVAPPDFNAHLRSAGYDLRSEVDSRSTVEGDPLGDLLGDDEPFAAKHTPTPQPPRREAAPRPRYAAEAPPPPAHRQRRAGALSGEEEAVPGPTGADPWAELSEELGDLDLLDAPFATPAPEDLDEDFDEDFDEAHSDPHAFEHTATRPVRDASSLADTVEPDPITDPFAVLRRQSAHDPGEVDDDPVRADAAHELLSGLDLGGQDWLRGDEVITADVYEPIDAEGEGELDDVEVVGDVGRFSGAVERVDDDYFAPESELYDDEDFEDIDLAAGYEAHSGDVPAVPDGPSLVALVEAALTEDEDDEVDGAAHAAPPARDGFGGPEHDSVTRQVAAPERAGDSGSEVARDDDLEIVDELDLPEDAAFEDDDLFDDGEDLRVEETGDYDEVVADPDAYGDTEEMPAPEQVIGSSSVRRGRGEAAAPSSPRRRSGPLAPGRPQPPDENPFAVLHATPAPVLAPPPAADARSAWSLTGDDDSHAEPRLDSRREREEEHNTSPDWRAAVKVEEQPSAPETYTDPFAGLGNDGLPEDSDGTNRRAALRGLARQAQSIGDYPASQRAIRELLREGVEDDEIHALQAENLKQIEAAYLARLGSLDRTPQLALTPDQLVWHNLDVHKGFVLSRVDGVLTARDIIDIVHLPRRDTIRLLAELVQDGILVMKKGR